MRQIFDIHGGIHPPERKELADPGYVHEMPLPSKLVLPISQHIGAPARPVVEVGDAVKGGQMIAEAQGTRQRARSRTELRHRYCH